MTVMTVKDDDDEDCGGDVTTAMMDTYLEELAKDLYLDHTQLWILDDLNPVLLEELFESDGGVDDDDENTNNGNDKSALQVPPSILWVQGYNAFWTRHMLRTSGLDRMIQQRCCCSGGGSSGDDQEKKHQNNNNSNNSSDCVFVGEGAGARCAGPTMAVAHAFGDDPKASPELQIQGLNLLGDDRWVSMGINSATLQSHSKTKDIVPNIEMCDEDQVYVWAQSSSPPPPRGDGSMPPRTATKFIMTPQRRGTIERYTTPDPLPPLFIRTTSSSMDEDEEGVACYGEPALDPSRAVQNPLGDSDWLEEVQ